ncbi:hypothetical protein BDN72DRAFT_963806 [Pluteus cervinus]|uniref:Uncharacterized protein n=1 Tax=Pluteus cervinus TaxID=181527 RepID=A0ACD3AE48_9AGAR|nr:hypothetical protein BDN72DRAFT_963806 [Pluteus cervinus]
MAFSTSHIYSHLPSFRTDGLPPDEVRRKLDEEISQLQTRIIMLKTFRNSFASISRLPTELLSRVFTHVQGWYTRTKGRNHGDRIFIITWVCRQWRHTALASPQLWAIIADITQESPMNINQIEAFIQRSQNLPLSIILSSPSEKVLTTSLSQMSRIQGLGLTNAVMDDSDLKVLKTLSQPAPQLVALTFKEISFSSINLFSGIHPKLDSIRFTACELAFTSPEGRSLVLSSTLTCLHIIDHFPLIQVASFSKVLVALPRLQELLLDNSLDDHPFPHAPPQVTLPNLQTLKFIDEYPSALGFLAWLKVPSASVFVSLEGNTDWSNFSFHFRQYQHQMSLTIRGVSITQESPTTATVSITGMHLYHRLSLQLEATVYQIAAVVRMLDVSEISNISMHGFPIDPVDMWLLLEVKSLEVLSFSGDPEDVDSVAGFLSYKDDDPDDVFYGEIFPKLKELNLGELGDEVYETLLKELILREEAGLGSVKLSVVGREIQGRSASEEDS